MYMCCIVINRDGGSCLSKIKSSGHHPLSYNKNKRKRCKPNDLPSVKQTRKMNESLSPHSCENVLCHFVSQHLYGEASVRGDKFFLPGWVFVVRLISD